MSDLDEGWRRASHRLVLMRHAQAQPAAFGDFAMDADLRRPLSAQGRRSARQRGRDLHGIGFVPDLALISPSLRTRETWAEMGSFFGDRAPDVQYVNALYETSAEHIRDVLWEVDEKYCNIIVLSHNPGIGNLVVELAGRAGSGSLPPALSLGFPPAAMACFFSAIPWNNNWNSEMKLYRAMCD
ncbi:histidine phosphatase family protein [Gluconacetobacter entanii]|uniref:Histidine phosphatase family protein n=1 Tax=Gluconacetobacter entanii TaxID=108528 RepID=A0A318Q1U4_9PROT|nr:histidine phosphatase family protein [Gluconacetobacter entanii]MCE2577470.1 histidine phosphatase family protein [Komagataeibacter sp. FNDCR1]MCW4591586.1 histidine phosphatase family protein [Gluconacetobacter entanii]MCW4595370.1 histidine phosphatase family protein [Gluconacetobacter entanii]NPC89799.1 phosphohistidine phosphatase [Gluconacetobacter entanii]PYD62863.1 phosphohistidine phosphatase [Gluconacetobacter entanii]